MRADHLLVRPLLFADYGWKPAIGYGLVCGCILRLSGVDFDAALELCAILDANPRGGDVADNRAVALDVDAVTSVNIADYFSEDDNLARVNLGGELRSRPDGEPVAAQGNGPVDFSVDLQVFGAGNMTLDLQAGAETRLAASGGAGERGGRRAAEGDDRGFYCLGRCRWFSLGLLFGPHSFLP